MIVGRVFIVEVNIKAVLEAKAKRYNHHHCFPNKRPGIIITNLVENAQNSIILVLFQYNFVKSCLVTVGMSLIFIIYIIL